MIDPNAVEIPIHNGKTQCVTFRPNGHLVGAQTSGDLRQWKVDGGEVGPSTMTTSSNVYGAVASMDGRWIVSGDLGNKVIVWNAATHQKAIQISDHTNYVYTVDVSGDSKRIASGSEDCTARIFDIVSGASIISPLKHNAAVIAIKFSPDGSRIATATYQYKFVGIYDTSSGNKLFEISIGVTGAPITPLAWSPDGKQLFVATSGKITHFDTSTSSLSNWSIHDSDRNTAIVTHGQFIACSAGSSVSFWDYASRQQIGTIDHTTKVGCISISRDGRYLACGRDDGITVHNLTSLLPQAYLRSSRFSRVPLIDVSEAVLELWMEGNSTKTESILSEEIAQCSTPSHHALAARSLVRSHLSEWETAIEDAELSLAIKQSPIGHIARCLALVGAGKQEVALDDFDFVFRDGDPDDNMLLLVIKSILVFMCGKRKQAVSRLLGLITASNEGHYSKVLGKMYLKQGDYENAVKTLHAKNTSTPQAPDPLVTISLVFNWNFDSLEAIAWQRWCETLYISGYIKEVGEMLEKMMSSLAEDEKEPAHGRILQDIVTRTGQVTLLAWTGKSSASNSCLPNSPAVYASQLSFITPCFEGDELRKRADKLRDVIALADALVIYGRVTRLQPIRFAHFRLHLPCIVFGVTSLKREDGGLYHAEAIGLGGVQFTTTDLLPLKEAWRLVFVDLRIHGLQHPCSTATFWEKALVSDAESNSVTSTDTDGEMVHAAIIEEVPSTPSDAYTQALELIVHLGQPFNALLLLQQPDGAYKRVAADHEIVVSGMGNNVPNDIRVEVLEVL